MCYSSIYRSFPVQREEEIARRQAAKEKKKKEREERLKDSKQPDGDEEEEEQEEQDLPPIYIPDPPSPLYCGFYSLPGQFWLSMVHTHRHIDTYLQWQEKGCEMLRFVEALIYLKHDLIFI